MLWRLGGNSALGHRIGAYGHAWSSYNRTWFIGPYTRNSNSNTGVSAQGMSGLFPVFNSFTAGHLHRWNKKFITQLKQYDRLSQTFQEQEDLIVFVFFHKLSRAAPTLSYLTLRWSWMKFILQSSYKHTVCLTGNKKITTLESDKMSRGKNVCDCLCYVITNWIYRHLEWASNS
jgi:hypothetical protein